MMALMFGGLALVSIILAIGVPKIGVMHDVHSGAWSGPWIDKNTLGRFYVLSFSVAMGRLAENPKSWMSSLGLAMISIALILLSTSKTALVGLILAAVLVLSVFIIRRGPVIAALFVWCSAMMMAGLVAVMLLAPSMVFGLLHRDVTLTSRTLIWRATDRLIEQRPVKGFGYGAVWEATSASAPVIAVHHEIDFKPVNAHSSWKDARLELGMAGFWGLVLLMGFGFVVAIWSIPMSKSAYWTLPTLAALLQISFAESVLLNSRGTESFLLILMVVMAASATRRQGRAPVMRKVMPPPIPVPWVPQASPSAQLSARIYQVTHPYSSPN